MDTEQLKQALVELAGEDIEKGKHWFFPSNVSDRYAILLGLDLKQSGVTLGIGAISLACMVLLLRSNAAWAIVCYAFSFMLPVGLIWAYYTIKPITDRPNISISDFLKQRKAYQSRPKELFKQPNERL